MKPTRWYATIAVALAWLAYTGSKPEQGGHNDHTVIEVESEDGLALDGSNDKREASLDQLLGSASGHIHVRVFPHFRDYAPQGRDHDIESVHLSSEGSCLVYRADQQQMQPQGMPVVEANFLRLHAANLEQPIWIECSKPATLIRGPGLASYTYDGKFLAVAHRTKTGRRYLMVVNVVDIETYLRGVVPAEVYPFWPEETLKTQTVAARTYAVFHRARARTSQKARYFDVDDTIAFQAYTGLSDADPRTDAAIEATVGEILRFQDKAIEAYYHADSGGYLDSANDIWGVNAPYTASKPELLGDRVLQSPTWEQFIDRSLLEQHLRRLGYIATSERLVTLATVSATQTPGGRTQDLKVTTSKGVEVRFGVRDLKRLTSLPSSLFEVMESESGWLLVGRGSGHGVGLNQRGAMALARDRGWTYRQILGFYYPGTAICSDARLDDSVAACQDDQNIQM